jgi:ankyrin repeat protein
MIHGLFPDRISLDCISAGCRSEFLSPFHTWKYPRPYDYSQNEYIPTSQIHLRLQFAISCGLENVFFNILDASSQTINLNTKLGGSAMLLQASKIGHDRILRTLLDRGVDVNLADGNGQTALLWASKNGHDAVVKLLLQAKGIDVNSKHINNWIALIFASANGHDSVIKLLLQAEGIDINSKDINGDTALLRASRIGGASIVKLLLQAKGIDINSKDKYGHTALSRAAERGYDSVVKLLLQAKAVGINSALSRALRYNKASTA